MYLSSLLHQTGKAGESVGRAGEELPGFPPPPLVGRAATSPLTQAQAHPLPPLPLLLHPDPFRILDTCDSFPLRSDLRPQSTNPGSGSHAAVASLSNLQNLRKSEVAKKKLQPRSRMPRMTLLVVVQQWRKQQNSPCRFLTIRPLFAESIHTKGAEGRPAARCGTK